jgi:Mannosyltransferase (PIG-V)
VTLGLPPARDHRSPRDREPLLAPPLSGGSFTRGEVVRHALALWLLTRLAVLVVSTVAVYASATGGVATFDRRWWQWDVLHYIRIARQGYRRPNDEAFFPGFPLTLRAVHALGLGWVNSGLVVSFVAGGVGMVFLALLAELRGPRGTGERAVLLLTLSPAAVFLFAGYTESLFLALALPAWYAAQRGRWIVAGSLAALACGVRITGVFLAAALLVEFLTGPSGRRWRQLPALALPAAPLVAYAAYLHAVKGNWLAWWNAQSAGWDRHLTDPVTAFATTWEAAFGSSQPPPFRINFRLELVAMAVGVVLSVLLLWWRRWGEATFVGLSVVALATSTWYLSVPRAALLWWPLWTGLAARTVRSRWWLVTYLTVVAPLSAAWVVLFTTGKWAG